MARHDRMGLVYGAIDLRWTPDGRYVFLEIRQELGESRLRPSALQLRDHVGQVRERIDAGAVTRVDDRMIVRAVAMSAGPFSLPAKR